MKLRHRILIWIIPALIIIPFILISLYNHPALDDWWYAEVYKQYGFWGTQEYWYNNYTARFFSTSIMSLSPLSFGLIIGSKTLPILFLICLYFTFFYLVNTIQLFNKKNNILSALSLLVLYLLFQRDYFESIYWMSANVVYQFTFLYWLIHVVTLYKCFNLKHINLKNFFILIITSIAITGSNETLGGLILVESFFIIAYSFRKKYFIPFSVIHFIVIAICWAFMFAAKGNWSKIAEATEEHVSTFQFILSIKHSFLSVGYYSLFILKQPAFYFLCFYTFLIQKLNQQKIILICFTSFIISGLIYFISIFPTGILIPPLRVTNIAIPFLVLGLISIVLFIKQLVIKKQLSFSLQQEIVIVLSTFAFTIILNTPFKKLLFDLTSGKARNYHTEMLLRYQIIKNANQHIISIPKLKNIPRTIIATDVTGPVFENIPLVFGKESKAIIKE
jgi:hypothetical protein